MSYSGYRRKKTRGRKRKSDGSSADGEQSVVEPSQSQLPGTSMSLSLDVVGLEAAQKEGLDAKYMRGFFRELHCHVLKLLRMELKLNPAKVFKKTKISDTMVTDVCWAYRPAEKPDLGPADLLFLVEDFILKSDSILKENKRWTFNYKSKPAVSSVEHMVPLAFIQGSIKVLPKLCVKMALMADYCKDLLESCDGVWDAAGMYPNDSADIKLCLTAVLTTIAELLSWKGFQSPANRPLLKDALTVLSGKQLASSTNVTLNTLAAAAGAALAQHGAIVPQLGGALSIVRSLKACLPYCTSTLRATQDLLAELCRDFLARPWFSVSGAPERGPAFNQCVDVLVKTFFANVDDKLAVVHKMASQTLEEVGQLVTKEDSLTSFRTINKTNLALLFRGMCEALVSAATVELAHMKDDHEGSLTLWSNLVQTHLLLVEIAKAHTSRTSLTALLKRSQAMVQLFLTKGMPVMESALRVKSTEVLKLMKAMQTITRFLHAVCCHSKVTSDAVLAAHVPTIRSQCERITLEVKGMLILNKIPLDCITIAVLKNRDIQGNDILSQESNSDMDENESELPPDDSSSEDNVPEVEVEVEVEADSNSTNTF